MGILISFITPFIAACGYVPTPKLANNMFDEKVYVNAELSPYDPRNSIFVADTLREIVISKLGRRLAPKHKADGIINISVNHLGFIPLIYDKNGYVIKYKARLNLDFYMLSKDGGEESFNTGGGYNFDISPNSIISDTARQMAIRETSREASDEFISIIAIRGTKNNDKYQ